jgi:hypothetical protein
MKEISMQFISNVKLKNLHNILRLTSLPDTHTLDIEIFGPLAHIL